MKKSFRFLFVCGYKIHEREMDKTDIPGTFNAGATLGPVNETNMARIWNKHKQSNTPLKRKVFVATYTNEGLKFQMILGPLKFERSKRGGDYTSRKNTVATI